MERFLFLQFPIDRQYWCRLGGTTTMIFFWTASFSRHTRTWLSNIPSLPLPPNLIYCSINFKIGIRTPDWWLNSKKYEERWVPTCICNICAQTFAISYFFNIIQMYAMLSEAKTLEIDPDSLVAVSFQSNSIIFIFAWKWSVFFLLAEFIYFLPARKDRPDSISSMKLWEKWKEKMILLLLLLPLFYRECCCYIRSTDFNTSSSWKRNDTVWNLDWNELKAIAFKPCSWRCAKKEQIKLCSKRFNISAS